MRLQYWNTYRDLPDCELMQSTFTGIRVSTPGLGDLKAGKYERIPEAYTDSIARSELLSIDAGSG